MTIFCYQQADLVESIDISKIAGLKLYENLIQPLSEKIGDDFGIMFEMNYYNGQFFLDCIGDLGKDDYKYAVNLINDVCNHQESLSEYKTALMTALQNDPRYKN